MELQIKQIGNSLGVILPKAELTSRKIDKGDMVHVELSPYDPEFSTQMDVARKVMKKRRNALRELAK